MTRQQATRPPLVAWTVAVYGAPDWAWPSDVQEE